DRHRHRQPLRSAWVRSDLTRDGSTPALASRGLESGVNRRRRRVPLRDAAICGLGVNHISRHNRCMNAAIKWVGGSTLVAVVLLGSLVFAGRGIEAQNVDPETWVEETAEVEVAAAAPAPATTPSPAPFIIKRILPIDG